MVRYFSATALDRDDVRYVEVDGEMHAITQDLPWGIDRKLAEAHFFRGGSER